MVNWYPLLAACVNYSKVINATLDGKKSSWKYSHVITLEGAKVCVFYLINVTNFSLNGVYLGCNVENRGAATQFSY